MQEELRNPAFRFKGRRSRGGLYYTGVVVPGVRRQMSWHKKRPQLEIAYIMRYIWLGLMSNIYATRLQRDCVDSGQIFVYRYCIVSAVFSSCLERLLSSRPQPGPQNFKFLTIAASGCRDIAPVLFSFSIVIYSADLTRVFRAIHIPIHLFEKEKTCQPRQPPVWIGMKE